MATSAPPALTQGVAAPAPRNYDHAIALKVMRLVRPELRMEDKMYLEEGDPCYGLLGGAEEGSVTSELRLPPAMGLIHDGETFRICVSIHNTSQSPVHNVSVKVELLTQTKRVGLMDADRSTSLVFPPGAHRDFIMEYPLQEECQHTLMCNVSYSDDKEARTFLKKFKFPVGRTVRIKEVKIWTISDHVMIYVELKNNTKSSLLVDLNFCPSPQYKLESTPSNKGEVWQMAMKPDEVWRYMFRLLPEQGTGGTKGPVNSSVGRLVITWFGKMGERGRLESSDIQHRGVEKQTIEVTNVEVPDTARIHEPFTVRATLINNSPDKQPLDLLLVLLPDRMHPITFTGPSQINLGQVAHAASVPCELRLMGVASGILELSGIEIREANSGRVLSPSLTSAHVNVTG